MNESDPGAAKSAWAAFTPSKRCLPDKALFGIAELTAAAPVGGQEVAHVLHQANLNQLLLHLFRRGVFERLRHLGDEQFGEVTSGAADLFAEGIRAERPAHGSA